MIETEFCSIDPGCSAKIRERFILPKSQIIRLGEETREIERREIEEKEEFSFRHAQIIF